MSAAGAFRSASTAARSVIAGGLYYASGPSIVWFWPILVLIACTLAAVRLRREELDTRLARLLAMGALLAAIVAAVGRGLHGRPGVSVFQVFMFAVVGVFVGWAARQLMLHRETYFTFFAVACVAIWEGVNLLPTLWNGFVLAAVPAFAARAACVVGLGCGAGILIVSSRHMIASDDEEHEDAADEDDEDIRGSGAPRLSPGPTGVSAADPR